MTFNSFFWIPAGPGIVSDDWWPLPWAAPGLVGGEDKELSAVTQGRLGHAYRGAV